MSARAGILPSIALALTASTALAQEVETPTVEQPQSEQVTLSVTDPIYVAINNSNGDLVHNFSACTTDGHHILARFALGTDYRAVNNAYATIGEQAYQEQAMQLAATYKRAAQTVITNMNVWEIRQANTETWADAMSNNIATVNTHYIEAQNISIPSPLIHYRFDIKGISWEKMPHLCPSA